MSLLTADGVIWKSLAAAEKLPVSTTRTKTSSSPERLISRRAIASPSCMWGSFIEAGSGPPWLCTSHGGCVTRPKKSYSAD
ncbi:hypothetical protein D9M70_583140 [compost metagenome]